MGVVVEQNGQTSWSVVERTCGSTRKILHKKFRPSTINHQKSYLTVAQHHNPLPNISRNDCEGEKLALKQASNFHNFSTAPASIDLC